MLLTPFTSLGDVAQATYPIFPVRWLLRDKYPLFDAWRSYPGRSCVLVAGRDEIIPRRFSETFLKEQSPERQGVLMPDADHNSMGLGPRRWRELLSQGRLSPGR